jgi:hypothetical protein
MPKLNLVRKFILRYIANCHPTVFVFFICQKTLNFKKIQNATNLPNRNKVREKLKLKGENL